MVVVAVLTTLATVAGLAACTGEEDPPPAAPSSSAASSDVVTAATDFEPPVRWSRGTRVGDLTDQWLVDVTARGRTLVAAGTDSSANTQRPLFLVSRDAGESWRRARIEGETEEYWTSPDDVAAGPNGFLAVGDGSAGHPVLWESRDGQRWRELRPRPHTFAAHDDVVSLTFTEGRFYAVGTSDLPRRRLLDRVLLWTSRDGVAWRRIEVTRDGWGAGTPVIEDVVVSRDRVVVVGELEDDARPSQPVRIAVWRSEDGGRTFTADVTRPDLGGDFRAYVEDVVVSGSRILLAVDGDGADRDGRSSWDGVVVAGSFVFGSWAKVATPVAFGTDRQEQLSALLRVGGRWLLAGGQQGSRTDVVLATGRSLDRLRPLVARGLGRHGLGGRDAQDVVAGVAVGRTAVLVGHSSGSGSTDPRVWLVRGRSIRAARLGREVTAGRPTTQVMGMAAAGGGMVAVGDTTGHPTVWRRAGGSWRAEALPRPGGPSPSGYAIGVTATPGGTVAVGIADRATRADVVVWQRRRGDRWRTVHGYRLPGASPYDSVLPHAVAGHGRTLVMAADLYSNGFTDAYPLVSVDGGGRWFAARGSRPVAHPAITPSYRRASWREFRSRPNGEVSATEVAAVRQGFVMVGRSRVRDRTRAVAWRSRDGERWTGPVVLPRRGTGYSTAATSVTASGRLVVVAGEARRARVDTSTGWLSWASTDGGRTWRRGPVVAARDAHVADLVRVPGGLLALGSSGPAGDLDAAAWISRDGQRWRSIDLGVPRASGPGLQLFSSGVVHGRRLLLLGDDVPPGGGGFYTVERPAPRP